MPLPSIAYYQEYIKVFMYSCYYVARICRLLKWQMKNCRDVKTGHWLPFIVRSVNSNCASNISNFVNGRRFRGRTMSVHAMTSR
jgi:hypothetical protein